MDLPPRPDPPPPARWRLALIGALAVGALFGFFLAAPIAQDDAYHRFADTRPWLGVPNFLNVATNLPFAVVGLLGLLRVRRLPTLEHSRSSWLAFFAGVLLVAFGSAYYHWAPDSQTLVWDRLPMTVGFMGLTTALLTEQVAPSLRHLLWPALGLGVFSVVVWVTTGDLRLYFGVQLMPMVVAVAVLALFRAPFTHTWHLGVAVLLYALAKLVESADLAIYLGTDGLLSGHPLKHVLAAGATWWILDMLQKRRPRTSPATDLAAASTSSSSTGSLGWLLEREPNQADAALVEALDEDREDRV